jgi:GNAT superfamily N-acetyltransferase
MSRPEKALQADVTVRVAGAEDAADISWTLLEAFGEIREHYTDEAFEVVTPYPAEIEQRFAEGPIWVAELDDEIVGTVSMTSEPEGLYVRSMAVSPKAQGQGIGGRLLDAMHAEAAGRGVDRIFLYTLPFQHGALSMYEKYGYKHVRDTTAEEWYGVPGVELEKILSEPIAESDRMK